MSSLKKKVIVTTSTPKKAPLVAQRSKQGSLRQTVEPKNLLFSRVNFLWMIAGILLIALGMILMSGGAMPDPDVWDESLIYSSRRIVLAPAIIFIGLVLSVVAIFKTSAPADSEAA